MVRAARQKTLLNKTIAVSFCILELSKLTMYKFYYDYLKPKYGDRCMLLFTDTDSLCCHIETLDSYQDLGENIDMFGTSNFKHPLYSMHNHRALGKNEIGKWLQSTCRICRTSREDLQHILQ